MFILKTAVLNTLVTMTIALDAENSKKPAYRVVTCKFPIISLQCHDYDTTILVNSRHATV